MSKIIKSGVVQQNLLQSYQQVRDFTDRIVGPLTPEDCMVQSMDDVSPTRWHIAHTTWFFETFVLKPSGSYQEYDPQFNYLFNSYYNTIGKQFPRPQRGFISRPGLEEIKNYRRHVDEHMADYIAGEPVDSKVAHVIAVGLNHEQQHQELMLTDIKHVLSCNPCMPKYQECEFDTSNSVEPGWIDIDEGIYQIGFVGDGFTFDNESPPHSVFLGDFRINKQLVSCGEYLDFMEAGGYERPEFWLSLGWSTVQQNQWDAPMYWVQKDNAWYSYTLAGLQPINLDWPVSHISYFEADAFARWSGKRLPTELEWEVACKNNDGKIADSPFADNLMNQSLAIHPTRSPGGLLGGVWQWTSSSYSAYPGYQPPAGAIGEYNGKFMCNQYVLRGGSVATSSDHIRPTYRNFFPADARWQFSGMRLAECR